MSTLGSNVPRAAVPSMGQVYPGQTTSVRFGHNPGPRTQEPVNEAAIKARRQNFPWHPSAWKKAWSEFEFKRFEPNPNSPNLLAQLADRTIAAYQNNRLKQFLWSYILPCHYGNAGYPSCSEFGRQAFQEYGLLKALSETARRIKSCNIYNFNVHNNHTAKVIQRFARVA